MKKYMIFTMLVFVIILSGCKGSEKIQGTWYAANVEEQAIGFEVKEDEIVTTIDGEEKVYAYKQHALGTSNGIKYYGIKMEGENYSMVFPEKGNKDLALLLLLDDADDYFQGTLELALHREQTPSYQEYGNEYLK